MRNGEGIRSRYPEVHELVDACVYFIRGSPLVISMLTEQVASDVKEGLKMIFHSRILWTLAILPRRAGFVLPVVLVYSVDNLYRGSFKTE